MVAAFFLTQNLKMTNDMAPERILDELSCKRTRKVQLSELVAEAIFEGKLTLMDVVAVEKKQPARYHLLSEAVAYRIMER